MSKKLRHESEKKELLNETQEVASAPETQEVASASTPEKQEADVMEVLHGASLSKKPEKNTLPIELLNKTEDKTKTIEAKGVGKMYDLLEVARQHADGYQATWDASLKAYARHIGFPSLAALDECKSFLVKWGAKLKD